ncbi:response regulator transcription factor [Ectothiorhodospiraceae bacterium 2226]|nr:response regulator transcription factor [Ectothiorhodospiraceae bacterium 2226]
MIAAGANLSTIADRMSLSAKTISSYKARVMRKLGVNSNAELIRYVLDHGLITD